MIKAFKYEGRWRSGREKEEREEGSNQGVEDERRCEWKENQEEDKGREC